MISKQFSGGKASAMVAWLYDKVPFFFDRLFSFPKSKGFVGAVTASLMCNFVHSRSVWGRGRMMGFWSSSSKSR